MRYLGKIIGKGILKRGNAADEPIGYDLDIFSRINTEWTFSGQVTASADTLRAAFNHKSLRVQIEDGSQFDLFFDEKTLEDGSVVAHVASRGVPNAMLPAAASSIRISIGVS